MSEEKQRNILVSSDEIECNLTIRIPGETITMLARQFWRQGSYLRAIQFLMEGVKNIPWHITIGVLEGRLKFTGDPKTTVEVDNEQGLLTYAEALKKSEVKYDEDQAREIQNEPTYMPKKRYEEMRLQEEEKANMAAVKQQIALNKSMNAKPPMTPNPPPKKMLGKSFQEMKEESGYEDDAQEMPF